jgi:DNA polymerase-4
MARWLLHVDLDQFLAAVEIRRRPELRGRPVVVGGSWDPTQPRQVVATASYEARAFGVRSGMPLRAAAKRCPDAVFLPSDRPAYDEASAEVMDTLRRVAGPVEVWGWDEAVVGSDTDDPEAFAIEMRRAVLEATGLSCSVGIGDNKLRAKIATEFGKPRGTYVLTAETWFEVMGGRPTRSLWGIGAKTAKKLAALGIDTVEQLARSDARMLAAELGPTMGPWYHRLGRGVSDSAVRVLTRRVVEDIDKEGRPAARVGLKLRYRPFITITRSLTLPQHTNDPETLAEAAVSLLERVEHDRPVRLLGVRLEMVEPEGGY